MDDTVIQDFDDGADDDQDHPGIFIKPPYIFAAFFMLAVVLEYFWGVDIFRWGAQLTIGVLLMSFGAGTLTWCVMRFGNAQTNLSPSRPAHALVTDGPYHISRNPIYLSMIAIYLGLVVVFDIVWGLVLLVPLIYVIKTFVIEKEEAYLERRFGEEYLEFKASTRRWL